MQAIHLVALGSIPILAGLGFAHPNHAKVPEQVVLGFEFDQDHVRSGEADPIAGPHAKIVGRVEILPDTYGESLRFDGVETVVTVAASVVDVPRLPTRDLTAAAWVRIDETTQWGGIISAVSDTGDFEKGWVLGYDDDSFTFGISTTGADDGDGMLTYLNGNRPIEKGRWYHVVGTYDGTEARLYVNGTLDASTTAQSGDLLYDAASPLAIGAYVDPDERYLMKGRIRNAYVLNQAAPAKLVASEFTKLSGLADLIDTQATALTWTVEPFLCYATQTEISIVCEVPVPATVTVRYRAASGSFQSITANEEHPGIYNATIKGLLPSQPYYYQVTAESADGSRIETELQSFQTAVPRGEAFTFVMIGDTQAQPEVVKRVSDVAWAHRPNFVCIAGDLVTTGTNKTHWTGHFFPNMRPLINRVPLFPVLGNHEQNARHYYEYMKLPEPEYYYSYSYGDADFFVLDSEKSMGPGSEQYKWLEKALSSSKARWKFAIHHRPPYSSDENDHGDSWSGPTALGDPDIRTIVPLYEKYGIDIVFNGHIHVYERTFPILNGKAVEHNGIVYMTVGGGGGGLENFAPFNPWFGDKKVRTHHICFVAINGGHLQLQAIDEYGKLFDVMEIRKPAVTVP